MYTDYDVIIVGSGVAGLSASIYTSRAGLSTVVLEKKSMGGELVNRQLIENYPGFADGIQGPALASAMMDQACNAGAELSAGEVTKIKRQSKVITVETDDDALTCKAVILATGSHPRYLNVPGEKELTGKGVIYCATCDGPQVAGKPIVIAGAGDSGITEALYLEKLGCKITVLEFMDVPKASQILLDRADESPNIEVICGAKITGITGTDWVTGVEYEERASGEKKVLDVQGILVRIGIVPNTEFLKGDVEMGPTGQIMVSDSMEANVDGIFAAGDIRWHSPCQVGSAAGDGINAAMAAVRYLNALS